MPMATREEQRAYQRAWLQRRRSAWIEEHGPCVDCGGSDRLEVDHVDPTLKVTNAVWSWARERREAELAKCVVRCHDCHAAKTQVDGSKPRGEAMSNAKLTEPDVLAILASPAESHRALALRFGVSEKLIRLVRSGESWPHVPRPAVAV